MGALGCRVVLRGLGRVVGRGCRVKGSWLRRSKYPKNWTLGPRHCGVHGFQHFQGLGVQVLGCWGLGFI